jgi:hypothetical protein
VIGKIVLTMLVAAAKINITSIVLAFDQTRVPRTIQVPGSFCTSTACVMHGKGSSQQW